MVNRKSSTAAFACVMFLTTALHADIINIPADQPTIQAGIDAASAGDEVVVAPGTYNEIINFNGKAITLRSSDGADVTIIDGTALNNTVVKCDSGEGPNTVLEGFTITGGSGTAAGGEVHGGGMFNQFGSSPTVRHCIFTGNTIVGNAGGAGMSNHNNSNPTVIHCTFSGNSSGRGGGGMENVNDSSPLVINCLFHSNVVVDFGGGMYNQFGANPTLINCLFRDNIAGAGGAIGVHGSTLVLANCTLTQNSAVGGGIDGGAVVGKGGGIYDRSTSLIVPTNVILWNNDDAGGTDESAQIHLTGGSVSVNHSCIQGWTSTFPGIGNIGDDPVFVDQDNINFRLSPGSPCIDAADSVVLTHYFDLDGNPRITDDPSTADVGVAMFGLTVDMGAYEFLPPSCPADIAGDGDGLVGADDLAVLLGSWGPCD